MGGSVAESAAEDAVQEAFLELSRQPTRPSDEFAWMVRVVRNRLLSWHRSGRRRQARETTHWESKTLRDTWFEASQLNNPANAQELTDALRSLNDVDRQIVVMHHWGEMTFSEIADTVNASRSSVHRRYQSSLRRLRQQLTQERSHANRRRPRR